MGIERDRDLAAELDGEITLVVGSHTHTLLPRGERVGSVTIVQAGEFGEHLGRVEIDLDGDGRALVDVAAEPVPSGDTDSTRPSGPSSQAIEAELAAWFAEPVGRAERPLGLLVPTASARPSRSWPTSSASGWVPRSPS